MTKQYGLFTLRQATIRCRRQGFPSIVDRRLHREQLHLDLQKILLAREFLQAWLAALESQERQQIPEYMLL